MIIINKDSKVALYEQLYRQIRDQICAGLLKCGERLPVTREIAQEYGISRNTVIKAYDQLEVEGYIKAVMGSGYYVESIEFPEKLTHEKGLSPHDITAKECIGNPVYDFQYGNLDFNCYQSKAWHRCITDALDRAAMHSHVSYADPQGILKFREALSQYLYRARGVVCVPEQIIITSGHQHSAELLCNLFSKKEWTFATENPGYDGTRSVFVRNGFSPIPIPLEHDGLETRQLSDLKKVLLYITPSHQFPMGFVLPVAKRLSILKWAAETDSYVIEDDYDSELRYNIKPIPSLHSLDANGRTIYLGTFSKSMSPDLRVSYIVLPKQLLEIYRKKYRLAYCSIPTFLQEALGNFIDSGEYERHVNMLRTHFRKKNSLIVEKLSASGLPKMQLYGEDAGLHFIMSVDTKLTQEEIISRFAEGGIKVYPTTPFWIDESQCPHNQIMVGFSAIPMDVLEQALSDFINVWRKL